MLDLSVHEKNRICRIARYLIVSENAQIKSDAISRSFSPYR